MLCCNVLWICEVVLLSEFISWRRESVSPSVSQSVHLCIQTLPSPFIHSFTHSLTHSSIRPSITQQTPNTTGRAPAPA
jgi:hypothetical protein